MRLVLAGLLLGAVAGLTACGTGGESPSDRPSTPAVERSVERPSSTTEATRSRTPERTTEPAETTRPPRTTAPPTTEPTRTTNPPRTTEPPRTTTKPPKPTTRPPSTAVVVPPTQTTRTTPPPTTTTPTTTSPAPASASAAAAASADAAGLGPWGWLLLFVLVAALIVGGLLVYRAQRGSAWDTEARALESETRTVTAVRLPPVLSATGADRRGLVWPPVRTALVEVRDRWAALVERAVGDARRSWSLRIGGLLEELIAAVDAENEALAGGRDWMLLRPRVNEAERALAAALTVQPQPAPPAAGEPGPPAYQP